MSLADRIRSQASISSRPGQYEELEAIAGEVEVLEERAVRYAEAIGSMTDSIPDHHTEACTARYVACHAAAWLAERAP